MDIERDVMREIIASTAAVGLFIAILLGIGTFTAGAGFTETGAFALIGSIVFFVLLMALVGYWLANKTN